ncbi:E3 ubiquitin-protein ligase BRE1 [Leucoagaricus sp. SymC.cos]|nr:E3 ubiquitin-protein ligase BRE1 [Leucoagaricus sp. SymC.cos]
MHHESRKRPHTDDDDDLSTSKKRAVTSVNGSPQPNGVSDSDEPTLDNLEQFRKEAIFRRMLHYSRENERSQVLIAELEMRKNTCEAGYAAIVACWTQLVETIRLLVKPEDLPPVDINTQALFDLAKSLPDGSSHYLVSALEDRATATRTLVSSFVNLGEKSPSRLFGSDHYVEAQKATTTVAALQSEVATLRSQLQESRDHRELLWNQLSVSENRYERTRSKTVQALEARKAQGVKKEETEELQQKPSSPSQSVTPPPNVLMNGMHDIYEIGALQEQVKYRETRIIELDRQIASLRDQNAALETELRMKERGDNIYENPAYKDVVQFALKLDADLTEKYKQTTSLEEDVYRLTLHMERHDAELTVATVKQLQELQTMLQKRDADNARLREQRDQQNAELVERRHKDAVRASSLEQLKLLVESRAATQLEMELNQCKAHLAAHTGDRQLMLTYLHGDDPLRQRWEILEEQLRQANQRVAAMEQTISSFDGEERKALHGRAEMSRRILELTESLDKYRAFIGPNSSPDLAELTQLLKEKEEECEKLRLLELQGGEAEKALYAELDKLSSAWETLDRQVKSKVFDLAALEERLSKSQMDKAKAENKFYAAMRDKEAMEIEKKSFIRMLEKQGKAVEKLVDTEGSLNAQIALLEKETAMQKKIIDSLKENLRQQERTNSELISRAEQERGRNEAWRHVHKEFEKLTEGKKIELRQLEDSLYRAKKEAERHATRVKDAATTSGNSDVENLKSILKCSTCRINFRSTVLTKCMHTFCKDCVEKRIQTRQRKCPACNISFAQSEVQQFWFQ